MTKKCQSRKAKLDVREFLTFRKTNRNNTSEIAIIGHAMKTTNRGVGSEAKATVGKMTNELKIKNLFK
jgi:hypothetical protein